jgi:hypothetical protein
MPWSLKAPTSWWDARSRKGRDPEFRQLMATFFSKFAAIGAERVKFNTMFFVALGNHRHRQRNRRVGTVADPWSASGRACPGQSWRADGSGVRDWTSIASKL